MNAILFGKHRIGYSVQSFFPHLCDLQMRLFLLLILTALCATPSLAETAGLQILIKPDTTNPETGTATLSFSKQTNLTLLPPRNQPHTSEPPELQLQCGGVETPARYDTAISCQTLQWSVDFHNTRTTPYAVADQQNLYAPEGWWSLTEWNDIPRFEGIDRIKICGVSPGSTHTEKCAQLPAETEPPLILVWGKASKTLVTAQTTLTLYKDDPTGALKAKNLPLLQKQLEFLQGLFATSKPATKNIDLAWVSIERKLGQIVGAAGKQTFLANFAVHEGATTPESVAKLHWVSAHKLFHLLSDTNYPLWISESLTQYFGYKSLKIAGVHSESPMDQWRMFKERFPHAATGLYEAHIKVAHHNDATYYPLFYIKGAAFWQTIDEELQKADKSLNQLMGTLTPQTSGIHELPQATLDDLRSSIPEERLQNIIGEYLL